MAAPYAELGLVAVPGPITARPSPDLGRVQAQLNERPQFLTESDGMEIQFVHVQSRH
ncbi:hypothetical protein LQK93_03478 [Terrabacter sp. BE26]